MSQFDPYFKWLGIRPKDQPPHHYRLLGIDLFESDPDVIDTAANKQMAYLHGCATGEHADLAEELLNEISEARLCLLDPKKKLAYDAKLKQETATTKTPTAPSVQESRPQIREEFAFENSSRRRQKKKQNWLPMAIGVAGIILFGVVGLMFLSGDDKGQGQRAEVEKNNRPSARSTQRDLTKDAPPKEKQSPNDKDEKPTEQTKNTKPNDTKPLGKQKEPDSTNEDRQPNTSGWTPLFNGKDLTGWKVYPKGTGHWKVENGILIGDRNAETLFSERNDYQNFHFRIEVQCDGRLYQVFRARFAAKHGYYLSRRPDYAKAVLWRMTAGQPFGKTLTIASQKPLSQKEWVTQEIIADGPQLTVRFNGKTIISVTDASHYKLGHLALSRMTKDTRVRIRKIEVKELPPHGATVDLQKQFTQVEKAHVQLKHTQDGMLLLPESKKEYWVEHPSTFPEEYVLVMHVERVAKSGGGPFVIGLPIGNKPDRHGFWGSSPLRR